MSLAFPNPSYASNRILRVSTSGTDSDRGAALLVAYATAKTMTPASNNRVLIVLPAATYLLASALALDTSYIDLCADFVRRPNARLSTDYDCLVAGDSVGSLNCYRPGDTIITGSLAKLVIDTASDKIIKGLTVRNQGTTDGYHTWCIEGDQRNSFYYRCYFWQDAALFSSDSAHGRFPVFPHATNCGGTWVGCIGNTCAWHYFAGTGFAAYMYGCQSGPQGWGGDDSLILDGGYYSCVGLGYRGQNEIGVQSCGVGCFVGCTDVTFGEIRGTYVRCVSGDCGFGGAGAKYNATCVACTSGNSSFGGSTYYTPWAGTVAKCVAGWNSFGFSSNDTILMTGVQVNNTMGAGSDAPKWTLSGGYAAGNNY